ncbi:hypothetical protein [Leptolyngbya sp. FACHB-16]|nr:hypothetical protein [Leptolyngbya sp. FACHB-16]MBD2155225.1 hypothetical protein [Leptolyngbya sp. FACHB-16]
MPLSSHSLWRGSTADPPAMRGQWLRALDGAVVSAVVGVVGDRPGGHQS